MTSWASQGQSNGRTITDVSSAPPSMVTRARRRDAPPRARARSGWRPPDCRQRDLAGRSPPTGEPLTKAASAPQLVMRKWTYRSTLSARFGLVFRPIRPNRYVELPTVDDVAPAGHGGWGGGEQRAA